MLDHIGIGVSNLEASKAFFLEALAPLAEGMRLGAAGTYLAQDHLVLKPKTPSQSAPGGLARKWAMRSR
jgi:catechol 2,3-dioxygenase-like lactoylglutathione lyase family enzyme